MVNWSEMKPENVLFWSGAGISVPKPTCNPTGAVLTERAMTNYMLDSTYSEVECLYADLESSIFREILPRKLPRLETVLSALYDVYETPILIDILSDIKNSKPNSNHAFFAQHLVLGGHHVTANYDTCIERSVLSEHSFFQEEIVHYHGMYRNDHDVSSLGATLSTIENGFSPDMKAKLDIFLKDDDITTIFFVGYSGSDYFDATPYLLENADLLVKKNIIWHREPHPDQKPDTVDLASKLLSRKLNVEFVDEKLTQILLNISTAWAISFKVSDGDSAQPWKSTFSATEMARKQASVSLYNRIGYRRRFLELHSDFEPKDSQGWEDLGHAYWSEGKYLQALGAFQRAYPKDDTRFKILEGSIYWIRGELFKAQRHLWKLVEEGERLGNSGTTNVKLPLEWKARMLILYGKSILFMSRTPDCKLFVRKERKQHVIDELADIDSTLMKINDQELKVAYRDIVDTLNEAKDSENFKERIELFSQREALHVTLNYQVGALRRRAESPTAEYPYPTKEDFEMLRRDQERIGAKGEALLSMLLPGAPIHFTISDFRETINLIEITSWHRFRLLSGFILFRFFEKLRFASMH